MTKNQKNILLTIIIGAVLFIIAEVLTHVFSMPWWGELIVFLIVWIVPGREILVTVGKNIAHGNIFDENFLMALASVAAFALGEYPEAVEIILFYCVGDLFEDIAVGRSRNAVSSMLTLCPDEATVYRDGKTVVMDCNDIVVGDRILVKPGEKISLDAVIASGETTIDTSAITGESLPRDATVGDEVCSGYVNLSGVIELTVTKPFSESTASKIMELVENASSAKAKTEQFITRFARIYTPVVVIAAVLLAVIPPLFTGFNFSEWIHRALTFLIVSCPCALVISVPLSFFGGIGCCSKHGILVKGSNFLETLAHVKTFVFDKTGTLTRGKFSVTEQHAVGISEEDQLELAAMAESASSHPIALSLMERYGKSFDTTRIQDIHEVAGHGVIAKIDGREIRVGKAKLLADAGIPAQKVQHENTCVHIAVDGVYAGYICVADTLKPDTKGALSKLRNLGVTTMAMLTGDSEDVANAIAKDLDLNAVHAGCLPTDKVSLMQEYRKKLPKNGTLSFVGDGINDAPVLAQADVGIAMGGIGSDAAIEAADIVLLSDETSKIVTAVEIAKKTMNISRENIVFALTVKIVILILGALGITGIGAAIFADVGVSVIAILNAMRAMRIHKK